MVVTENDIEKLVRDDPWMMDVLRAAESLDLPDWWIGAGFLRNKVWDAIEGNASQKSRDVDLVYFNTSDTAPETDWRYDEKMNNEYPLPNGRFATKPGCTPRTALSRIIRQPTAFHTG